MPETRELRGRLDQLWGWAKAGKVNDRHDVGIRRADGEPITYYLMDTENVDRFTDDVLRLIDEAGASS